MHSDMWKWFNIPYADEIGIKGTQQQNYKHNTKSHINTHCIVDECFMLSSFYAYYNLYNIKYVFHRNTGFKPPSYNTSVIKSYNIYMCPSDLPP
jgi:hypothetical protein